MVNAIKHSSPDGAEIRIQVAQEADSFIISIVNPGTLPDGFVLKKEPGLGRGLDLAISLLPAGMSLSLANVPHGVAAVLSIPKNALLRSGPGSNG